MGRTPRALIATIAVLLAGVSCGTTTLAGAKLSPSPAVSASPSPSAIPSPTPTPAAPPDYGPPPAGVDLFYLQWPSAPTWLIGFDWTGKPRATVHLAALDGQTDEAGSGISVAPNGLGFAYGGVMTFDRLGRAIYAGTPLSKGSLGMLWSEDAQLLCGVETESSTVDSAGNATEDFYLVRRSPTGPPVRVAKFLHLNFVSGDMGYSAVACSHWLDRALLLKTVCCGTQGAVVLRLSDGARLGTWTRGKGAGQPVFSPDGQEVAEPTLGPYGTSTSTEVRLVLGGTVLARYGAGVDFLGFSGDNRFAVVANGPRLQVIEVSTRRVIWTDAGGLALARVVARPFSGDLVLAFTAANKSPDGIVVVHADGTSTALDGKWLVPMSWGSGSY